MTSPTYCPSSPVIIPVERGKSPHKGITKTSQQSAGIAQYVTWLKRKGSPAKSEDKGKGEVAGNWRQAPANPIEDNGQQGHGGPMPATQQARKQGKEEEERMPWNKDGK